MKLLLEYPSERREEVIKDLEKLEKELREQSRRLRFVAKGFKWAGATGGSKEIFIFTYEPKGNNKFILNWVSPLESLINKKIVIDKFKKSANYYGGKIKEIN